MDAATRPGRIDQSAMASLERFVAENDELLELERRLGRFNLFDALGIARAEIRHSNFLGWLLDPGESHGQGDLFLKAIVMDLLRKAPAARRPLSPVEIDGAELTDVDVRREWKHIDLLIHCRNPGFVIAIENKMHGFERAEKLGRYEKAVAEAFPGVATMFVFLNPDGEEAPDEDWFAYSYRDVHRVLRRVREAGAGSLGTDVGVIIDHYLRLLETRLMDDPKIAELCRLIYKNHKQAIDLIIEHGATDDEGVIGAIKERVAAEGADWLIPRWNSRWIGIIPASWAGSLKERDGSHRESAPVDCFVEADFYGGERLFARIRLVVGPSTVPGLRAKLIDALKGPPWSLSMTRKEATDKYTRIQAETLAKWSLEDETPLDKIAEGAVAWLKAIRPALDAVPRLVNDLMASESA